MNQATGSAGQAGFQSDARVREQVGAVGGGGGQGVAAFIFGVAVVALTQVKVTVWGRRLSGGVSRGLRF